MKHIKCISDWMLEDEGDTGITHFVADNISWLYPVDPKKINCAKLPRENKSLASAILDLGRLVSYTITLRLKNVCSKRSRITAPSIYHI